MITIVKMAKILGVFVVPHVKLEGESRRLSRRRLLDVEGGDDGESSEDEFNGGFGSQFDGLSLMECHHDDDGRGESDATERPRLEDQANLTQNGVV